MTIFRQLSNDINSAVEQIFGTSALNNFVVEAPKDPLNGDLATNVAMMIAAKVQQNPREIALKIKESLITKPYIAHIEVAGPGFINFTIRPTEWQKHLIDIINLHQDYLFLDIGQGQTVNVEYVSTNPTGPVHIGHARGAVYGDVIANLLTRCNFKVTREFYVNDCGNQIDTLAKSLYHRYEEAITKQLRPVPGGFYPGKYLIPLGEKLAAEYGSHLLEQTEQEWMPKLREFAVQEILKLIRQDLDDLGVQHDHFFYEHSLHVNNQIKDVIQELQQQGLVYQGVLEPPKGGKTSSLPNEASLPDNDQKKNQKQQLIFKATAFGDTQDRPLQKAGGQWAYFAAEIAYLQDKIKRGFKYLILVLGADHSGYLPRLKAAMQALDPEHEVTCEVKFCQLVNFVEEGVPIKMSKRAGNFTTVRDVLNAVGEDAIRFMMLTRKNDVIFDFDLVKVKEQSKDNPVFYVHYAYVRAKSVLENAKNNLPAAYELFIQQNYPTELLSSEEEIQLIKKLATWPKVMEASAIFFEPHRIAFYLQELASKFHSLWNLGKENNHYRFVISTDLDLTAARLVLAKGVMVIIKLGLEIIGIKPMEEM